MWFKPGLSQTALSRCEGPGPRVLWAWWQFGCGRRLELLGPDQFADLFFDLVHLRKAVQGMLREDLPPVEKDLERSRLTGGDRHAPELFVVIVQQVLRQTGGSGQIPSGGAVLDPHRWLLSRRRLAGSVVGHVSPPFVSDPRGHVKCMPQEPP